MSSGCVWIQRASVDSAENEANGDAFAQSISADGRYVAFDSSRVEPGRRRHERRVRRVRAGPVGGHDHPGQRRQRRHPGQRAAAPSPAISADGRYVAFDSAASNLVAGRHERLGRRVRARHGRRARPPGSASTARAAKANGGSHRPGDLGRRPLRRLRIVRVEPGRRRHERLDRRVRARPVAGTTTRVSVDSAGTQANADSTARRSRPTAATSRSTRTRRTWSPATRTARPTCSCATGRGHDHPGQRRQRRQPRPTTTASDPGDLGRRPLRRLRLGTRRTWSPATRTARRRVRARHGGGHDHAGSASQRRRPGQLATATTPAISARRPLRRVLLGRDEPGRRRHERLDRRVRAGHGGGHDHAGQRRRRRRPGQRRQHAPAISADGRYVAFASDATNLVAGDTIGARTWRYTPREPLTRGGRHRAATAQARSLRASERCTTRSVAVTGCFGWPARGMRG